MAIPPMTPPTIAPTLLVAATEVGVEVAEVVGVEVAEVVEVEVAEVVGVEVTEIGLVELEVTTFVGAATVDGGTWVDSGPPERRSVGADQ